MRKSYKNKFAMYTVVNELLEANTGSWQGVPAFGAVVTQFTNKLSQLQGFAQTQKSVAKGMGKLKRKKRRQVAFLASEIASAVSAYAAAIEDSVLEEHMKVSHWSILKESFFGGLLIVEQVIDSATQHLNDLADYGVDQQRLDTLVTLRDELLELRDAPRNAIVTRKGATTNIARVVKEIDELLTTRLDKLIFSLRSSEPQFYLDYSNARLIINYGTRHSGPQENNESSTQNRSYGEE